jgi:WD40 repeat protein
MMEFGPGGSFLVRAGEERLTLSPLEGQIPAAGHTVFEFGDMVWHAAASPNGEYFAAAGRRKVVVGRDDGEEPKVLAVDEGTGFLELAFSPDSRLVAAMNGVNDREKALYRVWDVASGEEVAVLDLPNCRFNFSSHFASDGRFLTGTSKGVVAWDVATGEHEILVDINVGMFAASDDGRRLLVIEMGEGGIYQEAAGSPVFFDLDAGTMKRLDSHGSRPWLIGLSRDGTVAVTEDMDGFIRVGPVTGEEPHLIVSAGGTGDPSIDPLGRWVISSGGLLSPMPDLSKPPLHTLPRAELIAKLKTLTNLRVVRDEESSTGWKLTHEPFQGWETVPTW